MILLGTLAAVATGILLPIFAILIGDISDAFEPLNDPVSKRENLLEISGKIAIFSFATWFTGYIYFSFWQHVAENVTNELRIRYLSALLKQEVQYLEQIQVQKLPSLLGENFSQISESIGQKLSAFIFSFVNMLSAFIVSLIRGVDLTAIFFSVFPAMFIIIAILGAIVKKVSLSKILGLAKMTDKIDETLLGIKVVKSFAQEDREISMFQEISEQSRLKSVKAEYFTCAFIAILKFVIFGFYGINLWIATIYIDEKKINPNTGKQYTVGEIFSIIFCVMSCSAMTFQLIPNLQAVLKVKIIGKQIFDVIERKPQQEQYETISEQILPDFKSIIFDKVTFKYPNTKNDLLSEVCFQIQAETSTVIVGQSGSGKSTIVQLLERFYGINQGAILLDKVNINDIPINVLRDSIGYVQQEPILLQGTIIDNILFGNKDASEEQIKNALVKANASFVYSLENGVNTYVGTSSLINLSGGQKQRIAIARALVKNPKILILDEATSALDQKSEQEVQQAIFNLQNNNDGDKKRGQQITIIMIAHRLQTIQTAENIIYFDKDQGDLQISQASKGSLEYDQIMKKLIDQSKSSKSIENQEELVPKQMGQSKSQQLQQVRINEEFIAIPTEGAQPQIDQIESLNQYNNEESESLPVMVHLRKDSNNESGTFNNIMKYYGPKYMVVISFIASFIDAFAYPLNGYIFAKILFVLINNPYSKTYEEDRNFWCSSFMGLVLAAGLSDFLNNGIHKHLSENLTNNVRVKLYSSIMRKGFAWFDNQKRTPGILSGYLTEEIRHLNGLTSQAINNTLESIFCLLIGILIAFFNSWRLALIGMVASPMVVIGGVALQIALWNRAQNHTKAGSKEKVKIQPYDLANSLISEVLTNYKTVISFGPKNIGYLIEKYNLLLLEPQRNAIKYAHYSGIMYGYSMSSMYLFAALMFGIAAKYIVIYYDPPEESFIAIYTMLYAALQSGVLISQVPSLDRAKQASEKIFSIINEQDITDRIPQKMLVNSQHQIQNGTIQFKNVQFKYPSREENLFQRLNFEIQGGQKVAIVGHSGSGKSTIANLILRMYEITGGQILIDGIDMNQIETNILLSCIGYVMQEPILFDMSIKDNIKYGNIEATDHQLRISAKLANALHFIETIKQQGQSTNSNDFLDIQEIEEQNSINQLKEIYVENPILEKELQTLIEEQAIQDPQIRVIKQIVSAANQQIREKISKNVKIFIKVINESIEKHYDNLKVIKNFYWEVEVQDIKNFVQLKSTADEKYKQQIEVALTDNIEQFDIITVEEYLKLNLESINQLACPNFEDLINDKQNQDRIKTKQNFLEEQLEQIKSNSEKFSLQNEGKLHNGFNRSCGPKGSKLSGGQKQRIAIARALIKNPRILILDEATSALDEQSQEQVQKALETAMEGRTCIVIAHRLSTIQNCQWIIVMDKGEIVEQGSFQDLSLNQFSYFNKLKAKMES
ncbi:abc transporter [Stylonychia lemnae]|uniref:Abc transporter n=1 Tax=Stylonychia lemnae TaxID=5949 RepID=A0A078AV49_STYLE|nr:abc transporter [Stylonychia lemnae]|eukprot:CDW86275.1 abc transporter [Stylonychia lemnae]